MPRAPKTQQQKQTSQRALAYLRVSTLAQQRDGKNLDSQLDEVRAYCQRKGYVLDEDDVFKDIISGSKFDRKDYYRLLARIERADAHVIVSYEVSRIGRNGLDNAWLLVKAKEHGFRIETSTGGRDYLADPEGEFMFDILSAVAKYERNAILHRMTRGKRHAHKQGGWVHGAAPHGYMTQGRRGARELVPDAAAANHVLEVFTRYAEGASLQTLATYLSTVDDSRPWRPNTVGRMLDNATYIGLISWGEDTVRGRHQPLIPDELWERVRARRARLATRYPGRPISSA